MLRIYDFATSESKKAQHLHVLYKIQQLSANACKDS